MRGIREAAMSQEEETTYPSQTLWDTDRYDGAYNNPEYSGSSYKKTKYEKIDTSKDIIITMTIDNKDIGKVGDFDDKSYDYTKAETKATEIAYDRTEALLGKGFDSKFKIGFEVTDGYDEWEATVTLTPLK